jgi:hypothetical protein
LVIPLFSCCLARLMQGVALDQLVFECSFD